MLEFIGLLLVGGMFVFLELCAPWLQARRATLGDQQVTLEAAIALALLFAGVLGGTVIFIQVLQAFADGETTRIAISCFAAVIGTPLVAMVSRRLGAAAWRGRAGKELAAGSH